MTCHVAGTTYFASNELFSHCSVVFCDSVRFFNFPIKSDFICHSVLMI